MEKNKGENPLVSIVIPVYNIPNNYLERCISSVIKQSYKHIEIIIVNDCSPNLENDKTIRSFFQIDSRIHYINLKSNRGVSNARNIGLKQANGAWITFVDADDVILQNAIETMLIEALENQVEVVMSNIQFDNDEERIDFFVLNQKYKKIQDCRKHQYMVNTLKNFQLSIWGKLYKRSILDNIEFPDEITHFEDFIFLWEVILRHPKYVVLDKVGYEACYRADSASRFKNNVAKCTRILSSLAYAVDKIEVLFPRDNDVRKYLTGFIIRESFANRFLFSNMTEENLLVVYQNAKNLYNKLKEYKLLSPLLQLHLRLRLLLLKHDNWLNDLSYYLIRTHYRLFFK